MEKFTKPEILNFLCDGVGENPDDVTTSFEDFDGGIKETV